MPATKVTYEEPLGRGGRHRASPYPRIQPARIGDKILEQISLRLGAGDLLPGDKLPSERELAEQLGVSRNAVRESLRVLETSGVVTIKKGHTGGAFVSNGNLSVTVSSLGDLLRLRGGRVSEIAEVRLWIGEVAVRAACERRTPLNLEKLRKNLEIVEKGLVGGDIADSLAASAQFHVLLAECSQNSLLVLMMETIMGITAQFARDFGINAGEFPLDERRCILDAIDERKVERAIAAMKAHLEKVHSRYWSAVDQG